jgi:hypothetical protein
MVHKFSCLCSLESHKMILEEEEEEESRGKIRETTA